MWEDVPPRPEFRTEPRSVHGNGRPCFPYGGSKRVRFEGFESGSCSHLSPAPGALLNEEAAQEANRGRFSTDKCVY